MRKLAIVLGISALALVGCGEQTITEAEARIGGAVAEDHMMFPHGVCDFETSKLVVDAEDSIWLDRHAPICQDKGRSEISTGIPFLTKYVMVPSDEMNQIRSVESVDPEQFMEMASIDIMES